MKLIRHKYPLICTALCLVASQLWLPVPARADMFSMTEQQEIDAGRQVAAQAEKQYGGAMPYDHPMSVRVRAIGAQFAALSTRRNIPFSYKVLNSETVLNAFAAPGGPIYVTRKLVETTSNDAELAYVLGHETGHIEQKHIVKAVEKQQKVGLVVGILGALIGRGKSGNIVSAVAGGAFQIWQSGYSRDQEREADAVGARFMSRLGYDPNAAVSMLGKLGGGGGFLDKYLASHPNPKSRQANVTKQIESENLLSVSRQNGGPKLWMNGATAERAAYPPEPAPAPVRYAAPVTQGSGQEINLGRGLLLVDQGDVRVIMAPLAAVAQWAGGEVRTDGDNVRAARADKYIIVNRGRSRANLNGETFTMPAPAMVYDGAMYVPMGSLAQGLAVHAELDRDNMVIWLTADDRRGFVRIP